MSSEDECALCARRDVDDQWLWLTASRLAPDVDCEFDEAELSFCSQAHAASYLADHPLEWEERDHGSRTAGTRVDTFFLGCGLLAIILSVIGVIALVRWVW